MEEEGPKNCLRAPEGEDGKAPAPLSESKLERALDDLCWAAGLHPDPAQAAELIQSLGAVLAADLDRKRSTQD